MTVKVAKERDYYFDNAKFILIFFVVFGHLMETFVADYTSVHILYLSIYTFHMPTFILISGFFAKGFRKPGYLRKTIKKLILPYIFFQLIYSIFYYFLLNEAHLSVKMLDPEWSLWFLISLVFWNVMLLAFAKLKPIIAILIAILIGLTAGYFNEIDGFLSLSRTFVFFPFFLVGFFLTTEHFKLAKQNKAKIIGGIIAILIVAFLIANPSLNADWFFGSKPYTDFVAVKWFGLFIRIIVYMVSFAAMIAFFTFVPKRKLFFTKWGENTLYVYLLHGFFIKAFREGMTANTDYTAQTFVLLLAVSFGLTVLLSSRLITTFLQPVIELRISKIRALISRLKEKIQPHEGF
ncbi:acyltransferase family protein [Listeria sp. PSOL-1]|uniref:acyltransferase family protein n=1 Tax=Listeria sp. PSOL-1 TaxID=1844999 RepID=UPI0013D82918|nr:acyltransferase family protein [Listeria sp. PSOL-1]